MPPSMTPGSSIIVTVQFSDADMAFARHSQDSRNPFHAGLVFRGFPIHLRYGLPGCSPPFDGSNRVSPAPEGFASRLPAAWSPSNCRWMLLQHGLDSLCWRDLHPLEWQLASLHQTRPEPTRLALCAIQGSGT